MLDGLHLQQPGAEGLERYLPKWYPSQVAMLEIGLVYFQALVVLLSAYLFTETIYATYAFALSFGCSLVVFVLWLVLAVSVGLPMWCVDDALGGRSDRTERAGAVPVSVSTLAG